MWQDPEGAGSARPSQPCKRPAAGRRPLPRHRGKSFPKGARKGRCFHEKVYFIYMYIYK